MKGKVVVWFLSASVLVISVAVSELSSKTRLPGTNDKCAAYCLATYSPHTSDEVKTKRNFAKKGCFLKPREGF